MPSEEQENDQETSGGALTPDVNDFEKQQHDQQKNSVYDFLYHDARRISSFLAQFETYGTVQSIKATETASRSSVTKSLLEAGGGVPLVAQGKAAIDNSVTDLELDSAERTYDPLWTNAQNLLDFLASNDLIERDLSTIGIGRFVLVKGKLSVVDFSIMKQMLGHKGLKASILASEQPQGTNRSERRRQARNDRPLSEMEAGLDLANMYPMSIHATIKCDGEAIWCSVKEDCFSVSPSDLLLQYGVSIPGEWSMLGILDAKPDYISDFFDEEQEVIGGELAIALATMAAAIRPILGRPRTAFGATPLMIFRNVSGQV